MSAIIVAGNEIIPDTLTVTVDGTEITAKDFQKVLLNINQASATASVADGTDLMQKMEIINKNANACDVSFTGEGGATVKNLKQNQSMRLSWTGSFWYVTFGGLLSGVANDGTPFNYTTEVTLDEVPVNTIYTTAEQDTGMTWIDGKKIYRKSCSFTGLTTPANTRTSFSLISVSDVEYMIDCGGSCGHSLTVDPNPVARIPLNHYNSPYSLGLLYFSGTHLTFVFTDQSNNARTAVYGCAWMTYTKTTD